MPSHRGALIAIGIAFLRRVLTRAAQWARKHWRPLALSLAGVALVGVAVLYPRYGEVCTTSKQTGNRHCATYHVALVPIIELADFIENHDAAIVALGTLAIAAFTCTLWWTTRGTLAHLRREFEAEHRPWIPPDIQLASGWTWTADGEGRVTLRFTLRNIGRSPATNVNVRTEIFPSGWGFPNPAAAQKKLSQSERRDPIAPGEGMGWTIFPNSAPRYLDITMSISAADFEKSRLAWKATYPELDNNTTVSPVIVGCITYRFVGEQHQTGFMLELSRIEPGEFHRTFVLDPAHGEIPIDRLRLADYYVGSAVID